MPNSIGISQKFCNYENISECASLSKETQYTDNSQGSYYTTSAFLSFNNNMTKDLWVFFYQK